MKKLLLLPLLVVVTTAFSQTGTISGHIIDAQTLESLPFTSVFINNTTIGASADVNGDFVLKNVPVGPAEVMYSFVGYQTYSTKIVVNDKQDTKVNIRLVPLHTQLDELEVKAGRDKAWEKQVKRFEKIFFGGTEQARECSISNPWVIDFKEEGNKFIATASAPIEIINRALGYKVTYFLKDFWADGVQYTIVGNSKFENLAANTAEEAVRWTNARKEAYLGSTRHLFKAIIDNTASEQGFRLYADKNNDKTLRLSSFKEDLEKGHSVVQYKLDGVVTPGNTMYERKIALKGRIEVHYIEKRGATPIYKDVGHYVSWLEAKNGSINVSLEGIVSNSRDLVISGDMGTARVTSLLPLDYSPGQIIRVKQAPQFDAERLFETVYIQTNKPFYYPGEMIWFKGYMDYKIRGMADSLSRIMYVDIVNSDRKAVLSKIVRIDSGRVSGNIKLPADFQDGTYALVAYTNWMRNFGEASFFKRVLPVLNIFDKVVASDPPKGDNNSRDLEFMLDKPKYHTREQAKATIKLEDENNKPIKAVLSVAITDISQVPYVAWAKNDIRYDLKIPQSPKLVDKITHGIEYGITWEGDFQSGLSKAQKTDLTIVRGSFEEVRKVTTMPTGRFTMVGLDIPDSAIYNFQALKGKETYGKVVAASIPKPIVNFDASQYKIPVERKTAVQRSLSNYEIPKDAILLNGVEVKSTKIVETERSDQNVYGRADAVITADEISQFGSIETLLRARAPLFRLINDGVHWLFLSNKPQKIGEGRSSDAMPNGNTLGGEDAVRISTYVGTLPEPVLTIDNRTVFTGIDNTVGDYLMRLDPMSIDKVEISNVAGSYVGANGSYGLVAIFMKKNRTPDRNHFQPLTIKGYVTPSEFRGPDYADATEDHTQFDQRTTIYWGRDLKVGAKGSKDFWFYTSDRAGQYRIVIEGVTEKGMPVHYEGVMTVEE